MDLMTAVKTQSLDIIKKIVDLKGIPIDDDWKDYDILNEAVKLGKNDLAKYLLMKNCRVNKTVDSNTLTDTPLHHAVKHKDFDLVMKLLEKEASVEILNAEGNSPLHLAFICEQSSIVDLLLQYVKVNCIYNNVKNEQELSHLHIASTREDKGIIEKFLENGADVRNTVDEDSVKWAGFTALHFAVQYKSVEAVKILSRALTRLKIKEEKDIKSSCSKLLHKDIEKTLLIADLISDQSAQPQINQKYGCNTGMLYFDMALVRKDTEAVKNWIKNEIDVKSTKDDPKIHSLYPLHFAVDSNCSENVELLLKHEADITISDISTGMTPLHLALYNEEQGEENTIVDKLYEAFKNTKDKKNHTDNNDLSYLHVAVTRDDLETVKNYLDAGNSVDSQVLYNKGKFYHFSPLHFAVLYENKDMAELLIERGANVNLNDDNENGTPLHMAIATGNVDLINLLLKNDADVKAIRSRRNETVLHVLVDHVRFCEAKQQESLLKYMELFVTMGCNINAQDNLGRTALYTYAKYCENSANKASWIIKFLEFGADINLASHQHRTPLEILYYACENISTNDHCELLMLLYNHLQKLKAFNTRFHSKNIEYCEKYLVKIKRCKEHGKNIEEKLTRTEKERLQEIKKLKNTPISDSENPSSLYDLLNLDPRFMNIEFKISLLEEIIKDENCRRNFPSYGYLIKLKCRELFEYKEIKVSQKRTAEARVIENERSSKQRRMETRF